MLPLERARRRALGHLAQIVQTLAGEYAKEGKTLNEYTSTLPAHLQITPVSYLSLRKAYDNLRSTNPSTKKQSS